MPTQTELLATIYQNVQDIELSDGACRFVVGMLSRPTTNYEEPEPIPGSKQGLAAIIGKWPGDETDEEIAAALRELHGEPSDPVNHPAHYTQGKLEFLDALDGLGLGFYEGNILKYLVRWRHKGGVEDLRKAARYLERLIQREGGDT